MVNITSTGSATVELRLETLPSVGYWTESGVTLASEVIKTSSSWPATQCCNILEVNSGSRRAASYLLLQSRIEFLLTLVEYCIQDGSKETYNPSLPLNVFL